MLLEKEDEMDCLVGGANFLLKAIHHEAFMYENSQTLFTPSNCEPPAPGHSLNLAAMRHVVPMQRSRTDSGAIVGGHRPSWNAKVAADSSSRA